MDGTGEEELVYEGLGAGAGGGGEVGGGGVGGEGVGVGEEEVAEVEGVGDWGVDGYGAVWWRGEVSGWVWWDWGGAYELFSFAVEVEGGWGLLSITVSVPIMG